MNFFKKLKRWLCAGWWVVLVYITLYITLLFAMGGVYYSLTPSENGLYFDGEPAHDLTCLQAFYFSAVTITSLGYGDYQPMGWSRFIASAEVIIGLALMGLLIYKLTSLRTAHHLTRLYNSDITGKVHLHTKSFAAVAENMENSLSALISHIWPTPTEPSGASTPSKEQEGGAQEEAYRNLSELHKQIDSFKSFMRDENDLNDFFDNVPSQPMCDAIDELTGCIKFLGKSLMGAPPDPTAAIVGSAGSRSIRDILETVEEVLRYAESHPMKGERKKEIRNRFDDLESAYGNLSSAFRE